MKRIAFFQDNLDVGGIQKSIMNLLRNFDYEGYQVDLYLSDRKSFWHVDFPEQLTIKYLPHIPRIYSFMPFDTAKKLVHLDFSDCEEYDLAIDFNSYQFSCALGALTVPAKRRVMWIHNNVSVKLQNEWKYRVLWSNFKDKFKYYDEFVGVSEGVIRPFKECSGVYDKPFNVIQNVIDTNEIYQKAEEETDFEVDGSKMNFVAIGRLCHQKGYDIMLSDFCEASKYRDDLHLYIIGDGDKIVSQIPAHGRELPGNSTVLLYTDDSMPTDEVEVPNLTGMTVAQASTTLSQLGLYLQAKGTDSNAWYVVVTKQDIDAGTKVPRGTMIAVTFTDTTALD